MKIRNAIRAARGCGCVDMPRGAGLLANFDMMVDYTGWGGGLMKAAVMPGGTVVDANTLPWWMQAPESSFRAGSVATLLKPFDTNKGYGTPALVEKFEKAANGRWISKPGNAIYYTSLAKLILDGASVGSVQQGPLSAAEIEAKNNAPKPQTEPAQPEPQPKYETTEFKTHTPISGAENPEADQDQSAPPVAQAPSNEAGKPWYQTKDGRVVLVSTSIVVPVALTVLIYNVWQARKRK